MMKTLKMTVILSVILAGMIFFTGSKGKELAAANRLHTVTSGQTIWGIASHYMKDQDKTNDIRELVYDIRKANNLREGIIQPGDVLVIPLMVKK